MSSLQEYRYYYGVLLYQICFLMRIPKLKHKQASAELHKAFKEYAGITTMTKLNTSQTERYLSMIRMLMARERGMFLHEPNEPEFIEDWSMKDFLNYKLYDNGRTDSTVNKPIADKGKVFKGVERCFGLIQQD